jgi:Flp pilus assembly protein TadD
MPSPDVTSIADALQTAADELTAHGHPAEGRQVAAQLVSWLRARPPAEQNDTALVMALLSAEEFAEARSTARRLLLKHPRDRVAVGLDGIAAARAGDHAAAERAIVTLETLKDPYLLHENLFSRALIAAVLGQKDRAVAYLREGFRKGLTYALIFHGSPELQLLRGYAPYEELIRPKG